MFTTNCADCHVLTGTSRMNLTGKGALVSTKFPSAGVSGHQGIILSATELADLKAFLQ
ncbi:MAG: hypothetical protein GJT30_17315 [Geobacter sp.]|nr:hypothetical protein [Geobacter sp.]